MTELIKIWANVSMSKLMASEPGVNTIALT
jgi:hypothetical protein